MYICSWVGYYATFDQDSCLCGRTIFLNLKDLIVFNSTGGESRQSTNIVVKPRPISQILGSHSLSVVYNTSIKINCRVENAELVHWIAPNGSIVERHVRGSSTETYDVNNIIEDESWQCVAIRGRLKGKW